MSGETATWAGHQFFVYPMGGTSWHDFPGVFIFAGRWQGNWMPVYAGQTTSFSMLPAHGAWAEAQRLGATDVHARTIYNPDARASLAAQLIRDYGPRLNAGTLSARAAAG